MSQGTVLAVCTGNVCRSAYIERILRRDLAGQDIEIVSAGVGALVGHPIESRVAERLRAAGADAEDYAARQLTEEMALEADLIITASRRHQERVLDLAPRALRRTWTLLELSWAAEVDTPAPAGPTWLAAKQPRNEIARLADALSRTRGLRPRPDEDEAQIPDPWRKPDSVVDEMEAYIDRTLPAVSAALSAVGARAASTG